jgi:hypothetical protein
MIGGSSILVGRRECINGLAWRIGPGVLNRLSANLGTTVELYVLANVIKRPMIEEIRQCIYTSTLPLTCGFLMPKRGPKVGCNIFIFILRLPGLELKTSWL